MFVIKHKRNHSFYQKTIFKGQRHFVKELKSARMMTYKQACGILSRFKSANDYEIIEVTHV